MYARVDSAEPATLGVCKQADNRKNVPISSRRANAPISEKVKVNRNQWTVVGTQVGRNAKAEHEGLEAWLEDRGTEGLEVQRGGSRNAKAEHKGLEAWLEDRGTEGRLEAQGTPAAAAAAAAAAAVRGERRGSGTRAAQKRCTHRSGAAADRSRQGKLQQL
eukprot:COSAG02_NODE_70_length_42239_cov_15.323090_27_plen_161_part_00